MVKYNMIFKLKAVNTYPASKGSCCTIAEMFGFKSHKNIRNGVPIYLKYDEKGLNRK